MRRMKPASRLIALPLMLGAGTVSWMVLLASLAVLAAVVVAPVLHSVNIAQRQHNSLQATLATINEKIALQSKFMKMVKTDPELLERLADRQLNIVNPTEEVLNLGGPPAPRDVQSLIDESLHPIVPTPVAGLPWWLAVTMPASVHLPLVILALAGMGFAFLVEIRRV